LTIKSKMAVLKKETMKTPFLIYLVCSDSVAYPIFLIIVMMKRRRK